MYYVGQKSIPLLIAQKNKEEEDREKVSFTCIQKFVNIAFKLGMKLIVAISLYFETSLNDHNLIQSHRGTRKWTLLCELSCKVLYLF